jgi:FkbM family methyltransferase
VVPIYWTKGYLTKLVSRAYLNPGGAEHNLIKRRAREWLGLDRKAGSPRRRKRFIHRTLKAARHFAVQGKDPGLGTHPIDNGDLVVECFKTDTNTASVFLYGFSDNIRFFDFYRKHLRPGQMAIDVGANVGMHTLVMSRLVGASGEVISYEPSKTIFKRLERNIKINSARNVTPLNMAVGARKGYVGFADLSHETNIAKSHIDSSSKQKVMMTTLDSQHDRSKRIGLIKIDVEGGELDVLRGARKILADHCPVVFMELNTRDYSLGEVIEIIPNKCQVLNIPVTYYEDEQSIPSETGEPGIHNIAIIPY